MAGSVAEQIKEKIDIVDFLRGYLTLSPAGKNFKANCPFHKEKTPSFMISPDRQSWHCFGCSLGGDVFSFLMRYENLEFWEALRLLAEKTGVELRRASGNDYAELGILYDINLAAQEFFKDQLKTSQVARVYLKERGLKDETIQEFDLGWAPEGTDKLHVHLIKKGFRPEAIMKAGLSFRMQSGLSADRFRGRIMFPITNHMGKVVGFTGRILPQFDTGETGKYVNSPETPIFNKSRILYGFSKSKQHIREKDSVFLVEGQMDVLMSWQVGIKNIAATSGTAMTVDHLRLIHRLTDRLVLSFDSDEAGLAAGERAIDLAQANDFNVRVLTFSSYKDPAEAAQAEGELLQQHIEKAQPAMEFYFDRYLSSHRDGERGDVSHLPDLKKNIRVVLTKLNAVSSAVERQYWLKRLAERVGFDERVLEEERTRLVTRPTERSGSQKEAIAEDHEVSRHELLSQHLLGAALVLNQLSVLVEDEPHFPELYRGVLGLLREGKRTTLDPRFDGLLNIVYLNAGREFTESEFQTLRQSLKEEFLRARRSELKIQISRAEKANDEKRVEELIGELQKLF